MYLFNPQINTPSAFVVILGGAQRSREFEIPPFPMCRFPTAISSCRLLSALKLGTNVLSEGNLWPRFLLLGLFVGDVAV